MKRLLNDLQVVAREYNNNETSQNSYFVMPIFNTTSNSLAYVKFNYSSNDLSSSILDNTQFNTNDLANINQTNLNNWDIFYIDSSRKLHEVNNSEFLFDAFFDFIVRSDVEETRIIEYYRNNIEENFKEDN